MAQQTIDTTTNNGGYIGDPAKTAFNKANANFTELYTNGYRRDNVLGAVSQSNGVPTGAVIERGSNSNGEYVRFADGTQLCFAMKSLGSLAANTAAATTVTWAASFAALVCAVGTINSTTGNGYRCTVGAEGLSNTAGNFSYLNSHTSANTLYLSVIAIGRWY